MKTLSACLLLALGLVACAEAEGERDTSTAGPGSVNTTQDPRQLITPTSTTADLAVYLDDTMIEGVKAMAQAETGLLEEDIVVTAAVQVRWPDAGLGCGSAGSPQVLTDGYWILLNTPSGTLDYRSGSDGVFVNCVDGQPPTDTLVDR